MDFKSLNSLLTNQKNIFLSFDVISDMRKQITSILNYYKSMAFWSFLITLIITIINPEMILALSTKLCLIVVLWLMLNDRKMRQRLRFYKIRGVSNLKFFSVIFLFDSFVTSLFLLLIKGFI
jgi:hypothetical protein